MLIILAAVAGAAVAPAADMSSAAGKACAVVAGVASAIVAVLQTRVGRDQVEAWTRARSVSEAYKAEIYTYLAGVSPYRDTDKVSRFSNNLKAIAAKAKDVKHDHVTAAAPDNIRPVTDVKTYTQARVDQQIEKYYEPNAQKNSNRARQFRNLEFALAIIAAVVSAVVVAMTELQPLAATVPVLTTIAAVVTAEMAFRRYDALAMEYDQTADQLKMLKVDHSVNAAAGDPQAVDDEFVHACELVISIQNEAWMARGSQADTTLPTGDNPPKGDENPQGAGV